VEQGWRHSGIAPGEGAPFLRQETDNVSAAGHKGGLVGDSAPSFGAVPDGVAASGDLEALRARVLFLEREAHRRQLIEDALKQSEERYRVLVEAMNEGLGVLDDAGSIVYINDRFARMLDRDRQDLLGRSILDFVQPQHRDLFPLAMNAHGGSCQLNFLRKDGQPVAALVSPALLEGPQGEIRGSFAVFTDISKLKEAEKALAEERNVLRMLMDSLPDHIYMKDLQSRFINSNVSHMNVMGVSSMADILGKTDFEFFPHDLADEYYRNEQEVIATGHPLLDKVEQVVHKSGETHWVMTFKTPLHDADGNIAGIIGISRDITELRRAQMALRESEERFRLILENSRDIAYKLNLVTGNYDYVSPSAAAVSGFAPSDIMAMGANGYLQRVHPDDRQKFLKYRNRYSNHGFNNGQPNQVEYRFQHKAGAYRWYAESTAFLWDDGSSPIAEIGTIRDVSQSKEAEQAVLVASRMEATATLAGGIAHEFNNLMVGVLGNAQLLELRASLDDNALRMLRAIGASAQQASELAQKMLAFARGGKYETRIVDMNEVVRNTLQLEKLSFPPRITTETDLSPDLWPITADPVQMSQVVMSLSLNAAEAIKETGKILVATRNVDVDAAYTLGRKGLSEGPHVCLTVRDDGEGMSPDTKARVFEPFFSTKFPGRGLSLAAVYGIVKNHGGYISVSSEPGLGTVMEVYLPAAQAKNRD